FKQSCRRFFSGFNAGLIVGVDVNQRAIKADRAFIKGDQRADIKGVSLANAHGDRFAPALVKRASGSAQKSVKIVPTCNSIFNFDRRAAPILVYLNEG